MSVLCPRVSSGGVEMAKVFRRRTIFADAHQSKTVMLLVSEWFGEWVSEWVGKWEIEWVSERVRASQLATQSVIQSASYCLISLCHGITWKTEIISAKPVISGWNIQPTWLPTDVRHQHGNSLAIDSRIKNRQIWRTTSRNHIISNQLFITSAMGDF